MLFPYPLIHIHQAPDLALTLPRMNYATFRCGAFVWQWGAYSTWRSSSHVISTIRVHVSHTLSYQSPPDQIRTGTGCILSALSLPVGLQGVGVYGGSWTHIERATSFHVNRYTTYTVLSEGLEPSRTKPLVPKTSAYYQFRHESITERDFYFSFILCIYYITLFNKSKDLNFTNICFIIRNIEI